MNPRVRAHFAALRRRALAYSYDFSTDTNARIISDVRKIIGDQLEDTDTDRRTNARTAAHYLAQLALRPTWSKWLFEITAIAALPLFLIYAGLKGQVTNKRTTQPIDGVQLVFPDRFSINPEIFCIPNDLAGANITTRPLAGGFLLARDLWRVSQMLVSAIEFKTPFPIQLALKCAVDLSKTRGALNGLTPKWAVVYWEYSCALSFVRGALRKSGVATYNVMHGDKNFYAKNAFFDVDRCYCWDSYYVDLFQRELVRAEFRVFRNPGFEPDSSHKQNNGPISVGLVVPDLVTLSSDPREAQNVMEQIANACNALAKHYSVSIRPHPVYKESFHALRPHLSAALKIITTKQEDTRTFITRRALIVGTKSTMLLEAAHLGQRVIMLDTPASAQHEKHHYAAIHPNITTCSIDTFALTSREILEQLKCDRFTQSGKTDKQNRQVA